MRLEMIDSDNELPRFHESAANTNDHCYSRRKTAYDKPGPRRKIMRASSKRELNRKLSENTNWQTISDVKLTSGLFEVLVELKNYRPFSF